MQRQNFGMKSVQILGIAGKVRSTVITYNIWQIQDTMQEGLLWVWEPVSAWLIPMLAFARKICGLGAGPPGRDRVDTVPVTLKFPFLRLLLSSCCLPLLFYHLSRMTDAAYHLCTVNHVAILLLHSCTERKPIILDMFCGCDTHSSSWWDHVLTDYWLQGLSVLCCLGKGHHWMGSMDVQCKLNVLLMCPNKRTEFKDSRKPPEPRVGKIHQAYMEIRWLQFHLPDLHPLGNQSSHQLPTLS